MLVQAGTPVFYCFDNGHGCHEIEWFRPLIEKRYLKMPQRVPFLNLGAGSCQVYDSDGSEFNRMTKCREFIKNLFDISSVTTLRDGLSKRILNDLGFDAPVIPCPSIFARDELAIVPGEPEYIALNFRPIAAEHDLWQEIGVDRWKKIFLQFASEAERRFPVVFVCHNDNEVKATLQISPSAKIFFSKSAADFLRFYSKAKFYVGTRVHGAFATASFGRPAFLIGSDSRAKMMTEISLGNAFVNDVTIEILLGALEELEGQAGTYEKTMKSLKEKAFNSYMTALEPVCRKND